MELSSFIGKEQICEKNRIEFVKVLLASQAEIPLPLLDHLLFASLSGTCLVEELVGDAREKGKDVVKHDLFFISQALGKGFYLSDGLDVDYGDVCSRYVLLVSEKLVFLHPLLQLPKSWHFLLVPVNSTARHQLQLFPFEFLYLDSLHQYHLSFIEGELLSEVSPNRQVDFLLFVLEHQIQLLTRQPLFGHEFLHFPHLLHYYHQIKELVQGLH